MDGPRHRATGCPALNHRETIRAKNGFPSMTRYFRQSSNFTMQQGILPFLSLVRKAST
jgi:hypothetical protein